MVRKETTTSEQATAMRLAQAQATIRKLSRRLYNVPAGPYRDFILACLADVRNVASEAA